jgi:hypothetical protein
MTPDLFIGIRSWNSGLLLQHRLEAIHTTTAGAATDIVVLDDCSDDGIARRFQLYSFAGSTAVRLTLCIDWWRTRRG